MAFVVVIKSARGLRSADFMGKSDPYVRLNVPQVLDVRTAVVRNNLNPTWDEALLVQLPPSVRPSLHFDVFDSDAGVVVDGSDDFLGACDLDLTACDSTTWLEIALPLGGDRKAKGELVLAVRRYSDPVVTIARAANLKNTDGMFGKSDPYCKLKGLLDDTVLWGQTQVQQNNLNPTFEESFRINLLERMPLGGKLSPFRVEVWDYDNGGSKDDSLGFAELGWSSLWPNHGPVEFNARLQNGRGYLAGSTDAPLPSADEVAALGQQLFAAAIGGGGGGSGGAAAAEDVVRVSPGACTAVLTPGAGFKIADCCDDIPDHFMLGLAWDITNGANIDLDAGVIMLDANYRLVTIVNYANLVAFNGAVRHMGDEREGDEKGDDERVNINLGAIPPNVAYIGFVINSYSGHKLNDVADASCHLMNMTTGVDVASMDLSMDKSLDCTALLMCVLFRDGSDWHMYAIGEGASGRKAKENVDELQAFLQSHNLVGFVDDKPPSAPRNARITVPQGANQSVGFNTPGGKQQVRIPPTVHAGDVIEVPIVEIYTP